MLRGGTTHPPNPRAGEGRAETNNGDPPEFPGLQAMTRPLTPVRAPSSSTRIDAQVSGASAALREPYVNGRLGDFDVWMSDRGDSARGAPASSRFKTAGVAGVDSSSKAASSMRARIDSRSCSASSMRWRESLLSWCPSTPVAPTWSSSDKRSSRSSPSVSPSTIAEGLNTL